MEMRSVHTTKTEESSPLIVKLLRQQLVWFMAEPTSQ
jgi:hypothetical protein